MKVCNRLAREHTTLAAMVKIYCRAHHDCQSSQMVGLCRDCHAFLLYASQRLNHCPFADRKSTCSNCLIHCYRQDMQTKAKEIMRFSGPKMVGKHPLLALYHFLDSRKKPPSPGRSCRPIDKE